MGKNNSIKFKLDAAHQLRRDKKFSAALTLFDEILNVNPQDESALYGKVLCSTKLHISTNLEPLFEKLISINPKKPEYVIKFATYLRSQGKYKAAIAQYAEIAYSNHSPEDKVNGLLGVAFCKIAMGEFETGISLFVQLEKIHPNNPQVYYEHVSCLRLIDNLHEAANFCKATLEEHPGFKSIYIIYAEILRDLDLDLQTIQMLEVAMRRPELRGDYDISLKYAKALICTKRFFDAHKILDRIISATPDRLDAHTLKVECISQSGDAEAAVQYCRDTIVKQFPDSSDSHTMLSIHLGYAGRSSEAFSMMMGLKAKYWGNRKFSLSLLVHAQQVEVDGSIVELAQQLLDLFPHDLEVGLTYTRTLERFNLEKARAQHEKLIREHPHQAKSYLAYIQFLESHGEFIAAQHIVAQAIDQIGYDFPKIILARAILLERLSKYDDALRMYQELIDKHPLYLQGYLDFAGLSFKLGQLNDSLEMLLRAKRLINDKRILNALGMTYLELGDLENAAKHTQEALDLDPNYEAALSNLGHILENKRGEGKGKNLQRKAVSLWERARLINPDRISKHTAREAEPKITLETAEPSGNKTEKNATYSKQIQQSHLGDDSSKKEDETIIVNFNELTADQARTAYNRLWAELKRLKEFCNAIGGKNFKDWYQQCESLEGTAIELRKQQDHKKACYKIKYIVELLGPKFKKIASADIERVLTEAKKQKPDQFDEFYKRANLEEKRNAFTVEYNNLNRQYIIRTHKECREAVLEFITPAAEVASEPVIETSLTHLQKREQVEPDSVNHISAGLKIQPRNSRVQLSTAFRCVARCCPGFFASRAQLQHGANLDKDEFLQYSPDSPVKSQT